MWSNRTHRHPFRLYHHRYHCRCYGTVAGGDALSRSTCITWLERLPAGGVEGVGTAIHYTLGTLFIHFPYLYLMAVRIKGKRDDPDAPLTLLQELFVREYMKDLNGEAAYKRTGYKSKNPAQSAHSILSLPRVRRKIAELQAPLFEKLDITKERVMTELARVAFSDIRKYYTQDGVFKKLAELDEDTAAALSTIEADEIKLGEATIGTKRKVKLHDKMKALEMLAKHFKLFEEGNTTPPQTIINIGYGPAE